MSRRGDLEQTGERDRHATPPGVYVEEGQQAAPPPHPASVVVEGIEGMRADVVRELRCIRRELEAGAELTYVVLTASGPRKRDDYRAPCKSIGIYNPTGITIRAGFTGASATAEARAIPVAPSSLLVLPLAGEDLELGAAAADLAAGDAVVYVLHFASVQPAFFGSV